MCTVGPTKAIVCRDTKEYREEAGSKQPTKDSHRHTIIDINSGEKKFSRIGGKTNIIEWKNQQSAAQLPLLQAQSSDDVRVFAAAAFVFFCVTRRIDFAKEYSGEQQVM